MKRILFMLMVIATVFVLAACQVTPEKPIVVKKDTERLVEQAGSKEGGTALSELGIPQGRYTFDTAGANGKLRIHVDADILKPNVSAMPIVKVSMGLFSQEQVTGIFNYLFPDEKPKYDFGQVETKADIEQEILRLRKQLADGDYNAYLGEDMSKTIHIDRIELGLTRITDPATRSAGLVIPVWDFFGDVTYTFKNGEQSYLDDPLNSVLTINAIDGTLIDRSRGY